MARNRRRRRHLHPISLIPSPVGVGFVVAVSLALVYLWIGHKCSQYSEEIKRLDDQCVDLGNEKVREEMKWNAMKTADRLDDLLVRHGLLMSYPSAGQVVRVAGTGGPGVVAGQTPAGKGSTLVAGHAGR